MRRSVIVAASCLLVACGEPPTAPDTTKVSEQTVATVSVTSPIGLVIAVSGTATLTAAAVDANGRSVSTAFTWTSADLGVATVTPAGVVTGVASGAAGVTATADGVTGTLILTVADADLVRIQALLEDPLTDGLLSGIGGPSETALRATWAECASARRAGNLTALNNCLGRARTELSGNADPAKGPLVALVGLFVDWIDRHLNM